MNPPLLAPSLHSRGGKNPWFVEEGALAGLFPFLSSATPPPHLHGCSFRATDTCVRVRFHTRCHRRLDSVTPQPIVIRCLLRNECSPRYLVVSRLPNIASLVKYVQRAYTDPSGCLPACRLRYHLFISSDPTKASFSREVSPSLSLPGILSIS